ncbi:MAG: hypothetical protein Q4G26_10650 [Paracoccus sp. (in: a-proteobacteria)]|nr:hypothetical protein [Paracoccus sp. (in: a-proteobacteria)]
MIRLDPLTQSATGPAPTGPPRPTHMPDASIAPAEQVARFVAASDAARGLSAYESAYAAVKLRRRMTGQIAGLTELDTRLSGAAAGLRAAHKARPDVTAADAETESRTRAEARIAELRAAAAALNVAISSARSDVAGVLKQMQAELSAAMKTLGSDTRAPAPALDGAITSTSGNGEALIRRANGLGLANGHGSAMKP